MSESQAEAQIPGEIGPVEEEKEETRE